jgi:hypothetical protein
MDCLPKISLEDSSKDGAKHYTEKELSDATKDAAKNVLNEKGGLLDKLPENERSSAREMASALANDGAKTADQGAKEDTLATKAMAKDGPRDEVEQILEQGGRVVGALLGAIRGYMSGGLANAALEAFKGYWTGEQNADAVRDLWRQLPQGAREAILGVVRRFY